MREINRLHSIKQPLNSTRVNIYRELMRDLYYKSILGEYKQ